MTRKIISLTLWIVLFQAIAFGLGQISQSGMGAWYQSLEKSALNPPSIVFPVVWTILYIMIATAGWWLWQHRHEKQARAPLFFYGVQLIMNWSWTPLFFYYHYIGTSFILILLIALFTLMTIIASKTHFRFTNILLIPYFLWLLFAAYLNGVIWLLN
ncbi:MAG TPA: tryptophan-rich sensory protein [Legionella sp.]|nr:tryptophan-rich sensory protein [Legionella sp.]